MNRSFLDTHIDCGIERHSKRRMSHHDNAGLRIHSSNALSEESLHLELTPRTYIEWREWMTYSRCSPSQLSNANSQFVYGTCYG
jgi:hypothetical protein